MTEVLAIIPARGGSKGIASKNIVRLRNYPLIFWTINRAKTSKRVTRTIVTTDSHVIARMATKYGAEVPFLRPAHLARDNTPGIEPVLHVIQWLAETEHYFPDLVMCLQPTCPFRSVDDIDQSIEKLEARGADALVSLTPVQEHPYWMRTIGPRGIIESFLKNKKTRRQDLPALYLLNGAIYLAKCKVLHQTKTWYGKKTIAHVMPRERSLDIDAPLDLEIARFMAKKFLQ